MLDLVKKLADLLDTRPVDIEVIPGSIVPETDSNPHEPFFLVDGHLGIPKKALYASYIQAITAFQKLDASDSHRTAQLTSVILLANPDHNTALNRRKALIQQGIISKIYELFICTSLLAIPRNSKASLLWHHRRWLLRRLYSSSATMTPMDVATNIPDDEAFQLLDIPPSILKNEIALVNRAVSVYPRNYHAWLHRCLCLQCSATSAVASMETEQGTQWLLFIHEEYAFMKTWTETHVTDSTSMQYLGCVIEALIKVDGLGPHPSQRHTQAFIHHAESLARSYPSHEAVWMYLRQVFALLEDDERGRWLNKDHPGLFEGEVHASSEEGMITSDISSFISTMRFPTTIGQEKATTTASELASEEAARARLFRRRFLAHARHFVSRRS